MEIIQREGQINSLEITTYRGENIPFESILSSWHDFYDLCKNLSIEKESAMPQRSKIYERCANLIKYGMFMTRGEMYLSNMDIGTRMLTEFTFNPIRLGEGMINIAKKDDEIIGFDIFTIDYSGLYDQNHSFLGVKYEGIGIGTDLLKVRHSQLLEQGICSYQAQIWERSKKALIRSGVKVVSMENTAAFHQCIVYLKDND